MTDKDEGLKNITNSFLLMKMFPLEEVVEALFINDVEELTKMRTFYSEQMQKLAEIKQEFAEDDEELAIDFIRTFKQDRYRKGNPEKIYVTEKGRVKKILRKKECRGKK